MSAVCARAEPAGEGFYPIAATSPSAVRTAAPSVGLLLTAESRKGDAKRTEERRKFMCGEEGNFWNPEACAELNKSRCKRGCSAKALWPTCTVSKIGKAFVTARHCIGANGRGLARFQIGKFKLDVQVRDSRKTDKLPFDVAILEPEKSSIDAADGVPDLKLADDAPKKGEKVFGIGFPYLTPRIRAHKADAYDFVGAGPRATFGAVTDANPRKLSYCHYSNDNEKSAPEAWTLEGDCKRSRAPKKKYRGREERNPLLASADMIYGMSGSPLFNVDGDVLAIGSNVKASDPGDYSPAAPAIYSKLENVRDLLK